ncbi:response regulator [Rhizobium sp. L1K21]|uniref:response regulator n=1 Tax=Rhizobium sp. L1K21 TaxID=2954933 RepID=UPI0020927F46|nr:response regulator [Rhizobium sp. L1K21]MCO6187060.1 response regulator [Rhizobium sp. L1K21]
MWEQINILLVDDDPAEELILGSLMSKVKNYRIKMHYCGDIDSATSFLKDNSNIFMVLLDNRLGPGEDFRATAPKLRQAGFIGPIGVISSSLTDPYFQKIEDYGADFRLDKAEFDPTAVEFIIREYRGQTEPSE